MSVLIIGGSTSTSSKSEIILNYIETRLNRLNINLSRVNPSDFKPSDLVNYNFASEDIQRYQQKVASADVIIIATPVYQAAYSGALKLLLDLIPQKGLAGKTVLPLATGGSLGHLLALDYALKPVLSALAASRLLSRFSPPYSANQPLPQPLPPAPLTLNPLNRVSGSHMPPEHASESFSGD